ncbi:Peptidoglycan-binding (PGRP) domain of peptidoglycan hydrolases-containing protein [Bacillus sp. OV166]|uniref:peptidoglycan-binding protein n=1 Tax=Bacillus sp. OV166 TaxID=1882763 RepID=UPI000A2AD5A6|nr:peptidoglycan-binding protein [Bacillus sp. OV166]SMQ64578.1 Peptidoglycan-binding (PGRP) domain of peptidoglycan hydrolases-containing protein [Bacillus sp. OV166]
MGVGYLKIEMRTGGGALPVSGANIIIRDSSGKILNQLKADESGNTVAVPLNTPDKASTLRTNNPGPYYSTYDVEIRHDRFISNIIRGVQVFDTVTSTLPVSMAPVLRTFEQSNLEREVNIPSHGLLTQVGRKQQGPKVQPQVLHDVAIPEYITVHLAHPDSWARNVRVKFIDYIKNVASSEIYPTWPQASLEANIYAQITFALNRVYTEWYRSRGYDFDISNSTSVDQAFVDGGEIFENISVIVDKIFNQYVRRQGHKEPFFTMFCNGTTSTCPGGLSQWGTVDLAEQGMNPFQILDHYYPDDIEIVETNNTISVVESYPGVALREGSQSPSVEIMQRYLNRIRVNYPLIPQIANPNGMFGSDTTEAVKTFQSIFGLTPDGVIGKETWYKISYLYVAVKKLGELESEGEWIDIGEVPPTVVLIEGSKGAPVAQLQFILNTISWFYPTVPSVIRDAMFRATTKKAVIEFQKTFNLPADGVVGRANWDMLYKVYKGIENNVVIPKPLPGTVPPTEPPPPVEPPPETGPPYPGMLLRVGSRGESVLIMQQYLNVVSKVYPAIPKLAADGIFGRRTKSAVIAFQKQFGLFADGIIGPATWKRIVAEYNKISI